MKNMPARPEGRRAEAHNQQPQINSPLAPAQHRPRAAAKHALDNPILAEHAAEIRRLGKRVVEDVIEIGGRLTECKRICGHGNWLPWLNREFKWTEMTATRFINVYEMSKSNNLLNLELPISGLYLLAAPGTSKEARNEIIDRAQAGETIPVAKAKRIIEDRRQQPAKKSRRELYPREQVSTAAPTTATFEVGGELKDLIVTKAAGWTGATVGTQAEADAAIERLRDDGAPEHWLIVAPRERVVVDHRVIQWLLLTAPAPPVIAHIEWAFSLGSAANKARCPIWVSERLTGKSHPQRPGINWPRELPIPQQVPAADIRADSQAEAERLRVRVEELQAQVCQRDFKITGLESEIEELRGKLATGTGGDMSISEFQIAIKKWEETVETQRSIIARLENENAKLRAGVAASPADDGLDISECLKRSAS
jgi:hypothetical protein